MSAPLPEQLNVRALLDPEVAAALAAFPLALGTLSVETLPMIRQVGLMRPAIPLSDAVIRTDHDIAGRPCRPIRRPIQVERHIFLIVPQQAPADINLRAVRAHRDQAADELLHLPLGARR